MRRAVVVFAVLAGVAMVCLARRGPGAPSAPEAGPADAGHLSRVGLASLLAVVNFGPPPDEVTVLGPTASYGGPASVKTLKSLETIHQGACGYAYYASQLVVTASADAGWTGFLGRSGSTTCPDTELNEVDSASLVDGTIVITGGFPKTPTHRAGRGTKLHLVPYQDFAVPREIGTVVPRAAKPAGCLGTTDRPGVAFETYGWCFPTMNQVTCLSLANRCKVAIDAEGFEFTYDGKPWVVGRGCVIPAHEHALIVDELVGETPEALTLWVARCPSHPK